jgi:hypothetical protein
MADHTRRAVEDGAPGGATLADAVKAFLGAPVAAIGATFGLVGGLILLNGLEHGPLLAVAIIGSVTPAALWMGLKLTRLQHSPARIPTFVAALVLASVTAGVEINEAFSSPEPKGSKTEADVATSSQTFNIKQMVILRADGTYACNALPGMAVPQAPGQAGGSPSPQVGTGPSVAPTSPGPSGAPTPDQPPAVADAAAAVREAGKSFGELEQMLLGFGGGQAGPHPDPHLPAWSTPSTPRISEKPQQDDQATVPAPDARQDEVAPPASNGGMRSPVVSSAPAMPTTADTRPARRSTPSVTKTEVQRVPSSLDVGSSGTAQDGPANPSAVTPTAAGPGGMSAPD